MTPRKFAKNIIWGHTDHKTSTLHCHAKLLKRTEESLFYLLNTVILTDTEIWVYSVKYCDKFKAVVTRMNFRYNPVLNVIP